MRIAGSLLIVAVATYFTNKVDAEVIGTIDVGSVGTIYVWKQFGNIVMEGNGFRMTGDSRGYLLTKDPGASLTPDSFWQVWINSDFHAHTCVLIFTDKSFRPALHI